MIASPAARLLICPLIISITLIVSRNGGILAAYHRDVDAAACLAELHGLSAELMTLQFDDGFRVDACTIHHDGEFAVGLTLLGTHDGDGLSGIHMLSHLHQVLGIVGIHGFQTIVVTDDDDITHRLGFARESHITIKHRLDGVALRGFDAHHAIAIGKASLAHRKREGIFLGTEYLKVNIEGLTLGKEAWRCDAHLLLLGGSKLIFGGHETAQG